jgi:hypothetical protein
MGTVGSLLYVLAACLSPSAATQETDSRGILSPDRHQTKGGAAPVEEAVVWSAELRLSTLRGDFESDDVKWDDIFKDGLGFGLDVAWLMPISPRIQLGPYFSATVDSFQGQRIRDEDPAGPEILSFDHLMTARFLVGAASRQTFGRLFFEERAGVGGGYYFDTEFKFRDPFSSMTGDLIDASLEYTMELRFRAGIEVGGGIEFALGVGFEIMGAPDRAQDAKDFIFEDSFKRKECRVITAGLSARF